MSMEDSVKNVTSRTSLATREVGKLLPTEATAAFLSVKAMIDLSENRNHEYASLFLLGVIVLITLVTPWAAKVLLNVKNAKHRWVLAASFAIWACNIEFNRLVALVPTNKILVELAIPGALLLWSTLFLPIFLDVFRPGGGFQSKDEEQEKDEEEVKNKLQKTTGTDKSDADKSDGEKSAAQITSSRDEDDGVVSDDARKSANEAQKPAAGKDS